MGKSQQLLDAEAELEEIYSGRMEIDYLDESPSIVATATTPRWFNPDDPGEVDALDDFDDDFDDFDDDDDDDIYDDDDDDDDFYDDDDDDFDDDDEDW